jgi:hypothetical protein
MFRNTSRVRPLLAAAVAVVAFAAPATALGYFDTPGQIDHRSPDAVDAAIQAEEMQRNQARIDSLGERRQESGYVDHRSPDASDTRFVQTAEPATIVKSGSFDWGDAGIGAGTALGLMLIALSLMFTVVHRRNRASTV